MKKLHVLFLCLVVITATSLKSNAQTSVPANYYAGKWDVLLKGTPDGDAHIMFTLVDSAGTLKGKFLDPNTKDSVSVTRIEKTDSNITCISQYLLTT